MTDNKQHYNSNFYQGQSNGSYISAMEAFYDGNSNNWSIIRYKLFRMKLSVQQLLGKKEK